MIKITLDSLVKILAANKLYYVIDLVTKESDIIQFNVAISYSAICPYSYAKEYHEELKENQIGGLNKKFQTQLYYNIKTKSIIGGSMIWMGIIIKARKEADENKTPKPLELSLGP